jgi:outer membrane protein TolC
MKKRIFTIFLFLSFYLFAHCLEIFAMEALTLARAYELSLKRSEEVALRREVLEEAQGRFYKSLSVILPTANFVSTYQRQDAPKGSSGSSEEGATGSLTRRSTPQKKLVFAQPLFSGFKELAALWAADAEKKQRRHEWKRAREILFLEVSEAFYAVIEAQKDLEILDSVHQLFLERIREIEARVDIGRSREGELQSAIVEMKLVEWEHHQASRAHRVALELLEFYTGVALEMPLSDDKIPSDFLKGVADYLPKSHDRGDVKAAEEFGRLSENNVTVARSGLFPKVKLEGNYYTERVGFQSGIDWDVLLTVDIPIFDGAQTIGNIKEAAAKSAGARLAASKAKRMAELEVKTAYQELESSWLEEKALIEAAEASWKNYQLEEEDYRKNLVGHLEVLDALRRHQDILRSLNSAHIYTKKSYWKFRVAVGEVQ